MECFSKKGSVLRKPIALRRGTGPEQPFRARSGALQGNRAHPEASIDAPSFAQLLEETHAEVFEHGLALFLGSVEVDVGLDGEIVVALGIAE